MKLEINSPMQTVKLEINSSMQILPLPDSPFPQIHPHPRKYPRPATEFVSRRVVVGFRLLLIV